MSALTAILGDMDYCYFSTCVGDTMDMFPCSGLCGAGELVEGQQVDQCCSSAESKLVLS